MFERFTDRARRVVVLAQEEARTLNHDYIGTEHLLLGLIHEGHGVAAKALESLGISDEAVRQQIDETVGRGKKPARSGHIPFTPRAKKSLELSLREALQLGHNYIGTEHILLGLIREGDGPAAQVLTAMGADLDTVRERVVELLRGYPGQDQLATLRSGKGGRVKRRLLAEILAHVQSIDSRLSAVEQRVGIGPDLRDLDKQIKQTHDDKESAIDAQDFETAAVLRDKEKQLLADKTSRQESWAAAHADLPSLTEEVERLRGLLGQPGIKPHDGAA
jgi:Clp amino terminal domain, pathogenicity island component/UvrB/uvrC motif